MPIDTDQAPTVPGLYEDIPEAIYHGDKNSLSSSGMRTLLREGGPATFKAAVPVFCDEFDEGTAAHTLLLGTGAPVVEVETDTWTPKAKAERDKARSRGEIALKTKQFQMVHDMAEVARNQSAVAELLSMPGRAETSAYAMDPTRLVMLRARTDFLVLEGDRALVVDYKTTRNAAPRSFRKSAAEYGYHIQDAAYRRVLRELGIEVEQCIFIAQEKTPPYLVSLHEWDTTALAEADRQVDKAIAIYAECRDADYWPGYGDHIHPMSLPDWAFGE
ncbi:PD-(D/E)XK nuclease-like domain-containing protein [Nocardia sp. CC227C]|uniref:PD-(D/E)XK nuclease-like domain-containing protein n=1 Tax=Nocardia sp. CC227C TaxID=3044562 RepID=UPI00278C5BB3|nr:PD-(D/E)XK nuclease-like domain-containing protein [Nocardia sp. CC227C]